MRCRVIFLAVTLSACGAEQEPAASPPTSEDTSELSTHSGGHGLIFNRHAHPYGASMVTWSERIWKWIYRQPAASNPTLDQTGASCDVDQSGPVWFLASIIPGASVFHGERTCTIPRHKALLVQTAAILNDFPCPDPAFHPAPGQSLYDFLVAGAAPFIDSVNLLEVTIDGVRPDENMLDFRFTSKNLFHVTGDPSLQTVFDGCITGQAQPAVSDSYVFMVKPLPPGQHTLVWHTTDTFGMTGDTTLTYHLTVQ